MSENKIRVTTKQPGVYKNQKSGKYDVKYNFTRINPETGKKEYKAKWIYGIDSYTAAKKTLLKMKEEQVDVSAAGITLNEALDLWMNKAEANSYTKISIRNTKQQFDMITKFWSKDLPIAVITEDMYLNLIARCREYGYAEETIWNINACLRKLINLAYKNRYLKENPIIFWDSPRINPKTERHVIPVEDYCKLEKYFAENEFWRLGENHYPLYRFMVQILYWTGMRIGEVLALQYNDFEEYYLLGDPDLARMRIRVTKSYNSAYKLLKGTKNDKTRKVPLVEEVINSYTELLKNHLSDGGQMEDRIFSWDYGACNVMIKKACRDLNIREYSCHDFRHTYISTLVKKGVPISVIEKVSGDTQETIFKRYSHMFPGDEELVIKVLTKII